MRHNIFNMIYLNHEEVSLIRRYKGIIINK